MKKIIMIALVCTIGLTMFGCQGENSSNNKSSATQVESTISTESTTKEKIVCTITPIGGKKVVISDERVYTVYDLLKNQPTTDPSAHSSNDNDDDSMIDVILTIDNDHEYYTVYGSDCVFTVDNPAASDIHFVGYVNGIYKTISQIAE